jgi:hypothetical protein
MSRRAAIVTIIVALSLVPRCERRFSQPCSGIQHGFNGGKVFAEVRSLIILGGHQKDLAPKSSNSSIVVHTGSNEKRSPQTILDLFRARGHSLSRVTWALHAALVRKDLFSYSAAALRLVKSAVGGPMGGKPSQGKQLDATTHD